MKPRSGLASHSISRKNEFEAPYGFPLPSIPFVAVCRYGTWHVRTMQLSRHRPWPWARNRPSVRVSGAVRVSSPIIVAATALINLFRRRWRLICNAIPTRLLTGLCCRTLRGSVIRLSCLLLQILLSSILLLLSQMITIGNHLRTAARLAWRVRKLRFAARLLAHKDLSLRSG